MGIMCLLGCQHAEKDDETSTEKIPDLDCISVKAKALSSAGTKIIPDMDGGGAIAERPITASPSVIILTNSLISLRASAESFA